MNLNNGLYWFFRNLLAMVSQLLFMPFKFIIAILAMLIVLCDTSGSEVISWPWEDFGYIEL